LIVKKKIIREVTIMPMPERKPLNKDALLAAKREWEEAEASGKTIDLQLSDVTAMELLRRIERGGVRIISHDGVDNYIARLRALAEEES
jgi:hypothetical protein